MDMFCQVNLCLQIIGVCILDGLLPRLLKRFYILKRFVIEATFNQGEGDIGTILDNPAFADVIRIICDGNFATREECFGKVVMLISESIDL